MKPLTLAAIVLCSAGCVPPVRAAEQAPSPPVRAFRAACAALADAADKADRMVVAGRDGWRFLAGELRHVSVGEFWGEAAARVSRANKPKYADPLPAIVDFKNQLEKLGIELLLVPVPPKTVVYPGKVSAELKEAKPEPRLDTQHEAFYKLLREKGVAVLDIAPKLVTARLNKAGRTYCKQDSHWSGAGCIVAANAIAGAVKGRPWLKDVPKLTLASETRTVEITGDLSRGLGDEPPKEKVALRFVGKKTESGLEPVKSDRKSPVLLLGDSHALVFNAGGDMHAKGAGLADQLALELGFAVDALAVRGSGSTAARVSLYRRGSRDKGYLKRKKLIIWCFSAREFTESSSGWRKLPVATQ